MDGSSDNEAPKDPGVCQQRYTEQDYEGMHIAHAFTKNESFTHVFIITMIYVILQVIELIPFMLAYTCQVIDDPIDATNITIKTMISHLNTIDQVSNSYSIDKKKSVSVLLNQNQRKKKAK